jgi:general secretion pathway protein D
MVSNRIRQLLAVVSICGILVPALAGSNKRAEKFLKQGLAAEARKEYDRALDLFEKALELDPRDPAYQLAEKRARTEAGEAHYTAGVKLRDSQKLDEALVEFQKSYLVDPSRQSTTQAIKGVMAMIKEKEKAPPGTEILTPAEHAKREADVRIHSLQGLPVLKPISDQIATLRINNQSARVLYETVGKLAGINVLFDPGGFPELSNKSFNLDLQNASLEEALNYIGILTNTFWKPVTHNAIFVTSDTQPKRQAYQDQVVKVFYVQNATTTNEFTEIFNAVRTSLNIQRGMFQVAPQNAIIIRAPQDTVDLAEKLIHDLDKPKPEVLIDVIVLEASKSLTKTLSAALAGGTGGINSSIAFNPTGTLASSSTSTGTTTGTGTGTTTGTTGTTTTGVPITGTTSTGTGTLQLNQLRQLSTSDFSVNLPGALIQALMNNATTRVLQRPQIRATDGGKASLKIGQKIPYVQGSLQSAVATPGSLPYATTSFQSVDVGVNIDLQPHVNGPDEVSMHIKVEVSSEVNTVTIAGVQEPIIGQRITEADIRLKDGEMSILGALTSDSDSHTTAGIPGLANIPGLGYLFGSKSSDRELDDVLIAIVPHIVRAPDLSALGERAIATGPQDSVKVIHGSVAESPAPASAGPASAGAAAAPQPAASQPAAVALAAPAAAPEAPSPGAATPPTTSVPSPSLGGPPGTGGTPPQPPPSPAKPDHPSQPQP